MIDSVYFNIITGEMESEYLIKKESDYERNAYRKEVMNYAFGDTKPPIDGIWYLLTYEDYEMAERERIEKLTKKASN